MPAVSSTLPDSDALPVSVSEVADPGPAHPSTDGSALGEPEESDQGGGSDGGMLEYERLRRRLLIATAGFALLATPITAVWFGAAAGFSLLVGSMAGLLYLQLLARSVQRLGVASKSVGKVQLLVPLALVLAATRIPQLQILPAFLGFLLYKPALLAQALLEV